MVQALEYDTLVELVGDGWRAAFATAAAGPPQCDPRQLASAAGAWAASVAGHPVPTLFALQRHTSLIFSYGTHNPLPPEPHCVGVCDGLVTAVRRVALTVRTADCLPVVLAGGGVVAALHCGWRSLAADLVGKALRRLEAEFGVAAAAVEAVLGVGVGPCHYPVGPEVVAALAALPVRGEGWARGGHVDLALWTRGRLLQLGVPPAAVTTLPGCTACSSRHHSHRRDGAAAGRQWAAALLL